MMSEPLPLHSSCCALHSWRASQRELSALADDLLELAYALLAVQGFLETPSNVS
jgi:hypothetical protein